MGDDSDSPVFNNPELVEMLAKGNLNFALTLYKRLAAQDENMLLSPLGLSAVLAMMLAGAAGETAAQIRQTLHLESFEEDEPIHLAFQDILTSVSQWSEEGDEGSSKFRMASRLFLQSDIPISENMSTLLEQHYSSAVDGVDFAQDSEEARRTIDSWISDQTDGKISEMVGEGIIDLFSVLVLVSAVTFKGSWAIPFRTGSTELVPFEAGGGRKAMVDMMHCSGTFRQAQNEDLGCHILELPYTGGRLQMLVLLPSETEGLISLEGKLDADLLTSALESMEEAPIKISLPRFHVNCNFSLSDIMIELGMVDLFTVDSADLSGLSEEEGLVASSLLHNAIIEVDEGGTEEDEEEAEEEFVADHPFLFIVRDVASQMILLIGRLQFPATEELVL